MMFDPKIAKALDHVRAGKLGDIVGVDILRTAAHMHYEGGPLPPWHRDAGSLFRDLGAHCLLLIQELLGTIEDVEATWQSLGSDPNLAFDDWRAVVQCKRGVGKFQLTCNTKPMPSHVIIHGTKGVLRVDLSAGHQPPVAVEDTAQVGPWAEKVARAADEDHAAKLAAFPTSDRIPFVVTGASGSLGKAVVNRLRAEGHRLRMFVRRIPARPVEGVEYAFGNLGDPLAVERAIQGAQVVIHCGAAMKGGWPEHKVGTVVGTQNVIDACNKHRVRQLVHISSMSVFDWAGSDGTSVSESVALEPRAEERGAYTRAKLEAEQLVTNAVKQGLPAVILRPGQIVGGGIPLVTGAVARGAGSRWLVLGDGQLELPLVYIEDVVDAIMASVERRLTDGEIFQIVDPDRLTQRDVLAMAGGDKPIISVPRALVFAIGKLSEIPLGLIKRQSPIAVYRLKSALARISYASNKAKEQLGWIPKVGVRAGIRLVTNAAATEPSALGKNGARNTNAVESSADDTARVTGSFGTGVQRPQVGRHQPLRVPGDAER
ncbi:hypothetical protein BH11MYX2_BH11MYX2_00990 [soil metagenome]